MSEQGWLNSAWMTGLLAFLAAGGLAIWIAPFGAFAQVSILIHTALGVGGTAALGAWQLSHWRATRKANRRPRKVSAYIAFWLLAACILSGLVVAWQAMFALYTNHLWAQIHRWSGILSVPFLAYHVIPARALPAPEVTAGRLWLWRGAGIVTAGFFAVTLLLTALAGKAVEIPAAAHENIFAPGNVATESGGPLPLSLIANSDSCGAAGCHTAIYQEWRASAHRWSATDDFFQTVREATTEVQGRAVTEKCSGCHDPVALLSGHKDPSIGRRSPGIEEGDSCVVCHAVRRVDERGIGSYVLGTPHPYLYETSTSAFGRAVSHFLVRVYPAQHSRDYSLAPVKHADSCAPCHKEFDVIVKEQGPVQVETQYDDWKQGKWNTDPDKSKRLYCQQCHMFYREAPSENTADPYDLRIGLGRKYRNHYFAAGNQFMPAAVHSPDAAAQIQRVNEWLQGLQKVPETSKVWPEGPLVDLKIAAPGIAAPASVVKMQVLLTNRKVGHSFPTGPLNVGRAWLELVVRDRSGNEIFHSGGLDNENHITAGSYVLKPLAIDLHGQTIMEADLWHPIGPKYRPAILAGQTCAYDYEFAAPNAARGPITVEARLRYRKANQYFMDTVYPDEHRTAPITDISQATTAIALMGATKEGL